jgi:hypothetical protein
MKNRTKQEKISGGQRSRTEEDLKAKKWGGDGHITSPSFLHQGRAHGDQESSLQIISRTFPRKKNEYLNIINDLPGNASWKLAR